MKPLVTEKAVMMIESQNILAFEMEKGKTKPQIKNEIEKMFGVKIEALRTNIRDNKKYVYAKLKKEFPAIDVATKLGII
jgi:large subunit ribosomal protein L23